MNAQDRDLLRATEYAETDEAIIAALKRHAPVSRSLFDDEYGDILEAVDRDELHQNLCILAGTVPHGGAVHHVCSAVLLAAIGGQVLDAWMKVAERAIDTDPAALVSHVRYLRAIRDGANGLIDAAQEVAA